MATIICNGCFDLLHDGHVRFLRAARKLGGSELDVIPPGLWHWNHLIVAINSDDSARKLKAAKWGAKYPIDSAHVRAQKLKDYADQVLIFDTEENLHEMIWFVSPCIIVKGPDYAGREKKVTGYDIAPVLILDTPETEAIREFKRQAYML